MIHNPLQSGFCTYDTIKKGKSVHVLESLARLAYNKGTALFRGNDPLQRSAAKMLTMTTGAHKHWNMRDMALTGTEKAARLQLISHTSTRRGLF